MAYEVSCEQLDDLLLLNKLCASVMLLLVDFICLLYIGFKVIYCAYAELALYVKGLLCCEFTDGVQCHFGLLKGSLVKDLIVGVEWDTVLLV